MKTKEIGCLRFRGIIRRSFRFGKSVKNSLSIEKTACKYSLVKT
jgi:hypothetical protein